MPVDRGAGGSGRSPLNKNGNEEDQEEEVEGCGKGYTDEANGNAQRSSSGHKFPALAALSPCATFFQKPPLPHISNRQESLLILSICLYFICIFPVREAFAVQQEQPVRDIAAIIISRRITFGEERQRIFIRLSPSLRSL